MQDLAAANLSAGTGVAVREVLMIKGHGEATYLLYDDAQCVGVMEAKKIGTTLRGVEVHSDRNGTGLPRGIPAPCGRCRCCTNPRCRNPVHQPA